MDASLGEKLAALATWRILRSYITENNLPVSVDQIGKGLAVAHAIAVRDDNVNVPNLLSPRQVAAYHHEVFQRHNIPPSRFGGTLFGVSPNLYSSMWCSGCDGKP